MPSSIRHAAKAPKTSRGRWSHSVEHLRTEARKSIWFAFQTLLGPQNEKVQMHTLKVLTASLGNSLGIDRSEDLHNQTEKTELDFESYFYILETLMFEPLSKASDETIDLSSIDYQHVHNVCWVLFYNHDKGKTLPDDIPEAIAFKMWMLFNLFCEEDDSSKPIFPLKIDPEEAAMIFDAILTQTGKKQQILPEVEKGLGDEPLSYQQYIAVFFIHIFKNIREAVLKSSVEMVFEQLVYDILKKGSMWKRGHQVKNWKERYMVLNPTELKYYVSSHQKHIKGSIVFEKSNSIEQLPDKGGKRNLFVLHTQQKPYEMSAIDLKTRNEWISAIQVAIDNCENFHYHHHKAQAKIRRQRRNELRREKEEEERKRKEEEENFKRIEEEHKLKDHMNEEKLKEKLQELEDERKARAELEALLREQEAQRELERKRLMELEALNAELERLLELERQAKRDEETVRKLQAKLLEEESEKREEMERLKLEQEELLKEEREKREGLEGKWEEKKKSLADATAKLLELENEREEASQKLQEAAEKLQEAEKERHKMEEKVKLWKTPNVGLARPIQPKYQTPVTHRGKGAFCEADFLKKARQQDKERGLSKAQLDEKYGPEIPPDNEDSGLKSPTSSTNADSRKNQGPNETDDSTSSESPSNVVDADVNQHLSSNNTISSESPSKVVDTDSSKKENDENVVIIRPKEADSNVLDRTEVEPEGLISECNKTGANIKRLVSNDNQCQKIQDSETDGKKITQENCQSESRNSEISNEHNKYENVDVKNCEPAAKENNICLIDLREDSEFSTVSITGTTNKSNTRVSSYKGDTRHHEPEQKTVDQRNSNENDLSNSVETGEERQSSVAAKNCGDNNEMNSDNSVIHGEIRLETSQAPTNNDNEPSSPYENVKIGVNCFAESDSSHVTNNNTSNDNEVLKSDNVSEPVRNNKTDEQELKSEQINEVNTAEIFLPTRNSQNVSPQTGDLVVEDTLSTEDTKEEALETDNADTEVIQAKHGSGMTAFSNELYQDINSEDFVKSSDGTSNIDSDIYENVEMKDGN